MGIDVGGVLRRSTGRSALAGALSGAVLGPFLLSDGVSRGAALFYGALGGLVTGALVGCVAGGLASVSALLLVLRRGGSVERAVAVFAVMGAVVTGVSLVLLLPPYRAGVTALIAGSAMVWTAVLGRAIARRSFAVR